MSYVRCQYFGERGKSFGNTKSEVENNRICKNSSYNVNKWFKQNSL